MSKSNNSRPSKIVSGVSAYLSRNALLICIIATFGLVVDILLAKAAFDVIVNETSLVSLLVAVGISAGAAAAAMEAGLLLRRGTWFGGIILLIFGLLLGGALAAARWNIGYLQGYENELKDQVLALLMFALFVLSGTTLAFSGSLLINQENVLQSWVARRKVEQLTKKSKLLKAQHTRVAHRLERLEERKENYARKHQIAQARIQDLKYGLLAFSRDLIAEASGDPAKTGVIRQKQGPGLDEAPETPTQKPKNI